MQRRVVGLLIMVLLAGFILPDVRQVYAVEGQVALSPEELNRKEPEASGPKQGQAGPSVQASEQVSPQIAPGNSDTVSKTGVGKGEISFFFDDADIFEVAQTVFGDVLKVNYLIDPKVTGRVNFRTVTPIQKDAVLSVMEVIFRLNGMGFLEENGLYRIVPLPDVSRELIYSQVGKDPGSVATALFTFKNLNLKDSMNDIENAIGLSVKGGQIRVLPIFRLNALLVVASTKEQLDYAGRWVETLDKMFKGARPTVYVYPVQNSKAASVAAMLQEVFLGSKAPSSSKTSDSKSASQGLKPAPSQTSGGQAATGQLPEPPSKPVSAASSGGERLVSEITRIIPDEIANTVIILATPEDYQLISETLKKIDIVPRQVMIEAMVAEVKLTDDMSFGLSWSLKTNIKGLNGNLGFDSATLSKTTATSLAGFAFAGVDSAGVVRTLLETLASDSKVKVLASPHILVSDNREARIQVGDQVPIATSQTNVTGTTDIQTTIQYKDTGVILRVKPQINEGGLVALDISQEVSNFSVQKILGSDQVVISKREAETNLVAQDGQTIVIGGLIREDSTKSREGIPFLSKLPLLGYLFGSTTDNYTRTELVILLTPHVIRNQQEAGGMTSDYMEKMKGLKNDLKGYVVPAKEDK